MSGLLMNQVHGLGQADFIAALIGPLVSGGASVYQTYSESESSADELEQRQREFASLSKAEQEKTKAATQAALVAQQLAIKRQAAEYDLTLRRSEMRGAWWQENLPWVIGGGVLVALAVTAVATRKRR
jgi:hypothetical protein